jgi:hypothetical protein
MIPNRRKKRRMGTEPTDRYGKPLMSQETETRLKINAIHMDVVFKLAPIVTTEVLRQVDIHNADKHGTAEYIAELTDRIALRVIAQATRDITAKEQEQSRTDPGNDGIQPPSY